MYTRKCPKLSAKVVSTPIGAQFKLYANQKPLTKEELDYMSHIPYQNIVGSMMYAMVCTRPDIAYGVSFFSRFMSNPNKSHWMAVKWLARYLKGSRNVCLMYKNSNNDDVSICGFCDSDYAADLDKRRSISG